MRNGFTAYFALSPVSHVLLPPSTPTMGRQDHTLLPYASAALVSRSQCVHRNPSLVGNDGRRPSEWDGMREMYTASGVDVKDNFCKTEIFL